MTVEVATNPQQLNTAWPLSADMVSEGDDHIRVVKTVIKTTFPNFGGAFNATHTEANYLVGVASGIQGQINSKGAIAGQTWTGTHVFPGTTTIGGLTPTIRGYLETVTSDAQAQINARSLKAGDTYSGTHNYTGATLTVPTATAGDRSNAAASTAFVMGAAFSSALPAQAGQAGKYVKTDGTTANWSSITFAELASKPSTVSGYGITDGVATSGDQTIAGNKSFSGNLLAIGGALGYGVGAGATVVQATSKSTAVTLNKPSGQIVMHGAALAAGAVATFQLNNVLIANTDSLIATLRDDFSPANYAIRCSAGTGGCRISISNISGGSLSEAVVLNFSLLKGAAS